LPTGNSTTIASEKLVTAVYTVEIKDIEFQPKEITVKRRDTIIWINHDMVTHCLTEERTKAGTSSNITQTGLYNMCNIFLRIF
jgi:plastocyanin